MDKSPFNACLELYGVQVPCGTYPAVQRNAAVTKEASRKVPKPVVLTTKVNGQPARALLDSAVLYPPPGVLADSARIPWNVGIPLGIRRNGRNVPFLWIPMDSQWNSSGISMEIPPKFQNDSKWNLNGIPLSSKFNQCKNRVQYQYILKTYLSGSHMGQFKLK